MIVIGDTSALAASVDGTHPEREPIHRALSLSALVVVAPLVIQEIEHIVTREAGRDAAYRTNDWILDRDQTHHFEVPGISPSILRHARRVQDAYRALKLDLADAVNVVLAEEYETNVILTLDRRDFRSVAPLTGHPAFRILPDDL